jgi:hypothetical protein
MLALTTPTLADGTATWLYDVTTQDGDAFVEPGETATVTLTLVMEPKQDIQTSAALSAAVFSTIGSDGADHGHIIGWKVLSIFADLTGDLTTTDGVSLYNTTAGQLETFGPFDPSNPVDVFMFEWAPDADVNTTVSYTTVSDTNKPGTITVWECNEYGGDVPVIYPVTEAAITFTVIPAPPTLALLLLAAPRRRPRTEPRPSGRGHLAYQPHHRHTP